MDASATPVEWIGLVCGAVITGALCGFAIVRVRLVRRVRNELGKDKVLMVASSRLGVVNERPTAWAFLEVGILMLLKNGLYYHSWLSRKEMFISGPSITYIGVAEAADGKTKDRGAVTLHFLNALGKEDGVTLRLLSPDQWVSAIKTHLIARPM
jgi:hypothetical protein